MSYKKAIISSKRNPQNESDKPDQKMEIVEDSKDLSNMFNSLQISNKMKFNEVLNWLFKEEPNIIVNSQDAKITHVYESILKFNSSYEQKFQNIVLQYNQANNKFIILYKKLKELPEYYNRIYMIRIQSRSSF